MAMSKKMAKQISLALNDIRVSEIMRAPDAKVMREAAGAVKAEYFSRWLKVGEDAKAVLRNLGIEVV